MSTIIDIVTNKKKDILTVRHEYVYKKEDKYFVILKDGSKKDVEVGIHNEQKFEILSGVKRGEKLRQVDFISLIESNQKNKK